jgi:hypothetical protein
MVTPGSLPVWVFASEHSTSTGSVAQPQKHRTSVRLNLPIGTFARNWQHGSPGWVLLTCLHVPLPVRNLFRIGDGLYTLTSRWMGEHLKAGDIGPIATFREL